MGWKVPGLPVVAVTAELLDIEESNVAIDVLCVTSRVASEVDARVVSTTRLAVDVDSALEEAAKVLAVAEVETADVRVAVVATTLVVEAVEDAMKVDEAREVLAASVLAAAVVAARAPASVVLDDAAEVVAAAAALAAAREVNAADVLATNVVPVVEAA